MKHRLVCMPRANIKQNSLWEAISDNVSQNHKHTYALTLQSHF